MNVSKIKELRDFDFSVFVISKNGDKKKIFFDDLPEARRHPDTKEVKIVRNLEKGYKYHNTIEVRNGTGRYKVPFFGTRFYLGGY